MGYVDLRRRREQSRRGPREPAGLWHDIKSNPYLSIAAGSGAALPALWAWQLLPLDFWALPLVPCAFLVGRGTWQLLRVRPANTRTVGSGSEKQLLMTIRDSVGGVTPVEAALETSLTVDEAEEILTRLADRGHLFVESREGALYYALPGGRTRGPDGGA